ncbi:hypothetical protein VSH64_24810 [Amycolatopsis rhabdoformis]|uniref:Uncharacterized protein n=1 Tax=Amycolatopsis rhabdoformis TaxID=1448059 RepID=A0ABZ1HUP8_9PSEU|nr:hypothetical protein [Amycolatopsis rhabdoformis]WSE26099.1 hypothetical protein VSH64_24810 [Amycolatopsis rhabdoformis]
MSDLASLLPGIAAVITSIGGIVVSVYAINRGSKRERRRTAEKVIDRVLGNDEDDDEDDDRSEAIAELLEELRKRREGDDS